MKYLRKAVGLPAAFSLMAVSACGTGHGTVEITARFDDAPLANLAIHLVPYDVDAITDELDRKFEVPKPVFPDLEAELFAYQPGAGRALAEVLEDWTRARDAVTRLADSLDEVGRDAEGYPAAYGRFRSAYSDLARREVALERRFEAASEEDRDLVQRASRAADSLRRWERVAYAAFDSVLANLSGGRSPSEVSGSTDSTGTLTLQAQPGPSWMVARLPHPTNPFLEYAWNVPVGMSVLVKVVAPLSSGNVILRWRR